MRVNAGLSIAFFLFSAPALFGQVSAPPPVPYSDTEISLKAESLPPRYRGNDLPGLFHAIESLERGDVKGEFETTAQFEERTKRDLSRPLLGDLSLNSLFAFQWDPSDVHYDADAQELTATLHLEPMPHNATVGVVRYRLESGVVTSYEATNAYGVTAEVKRSNFTEYEIMFATPTGFPPEVVASIGLTPEQAKKQEAALTALLVCRLIPPFLGSATEYHEPTLQEPIESTFETHYLRVKILQVWFYNLEKGSILAQLSARE
jgi:hypothetical protein